MNLPTEQNYLYQTIIMLFNVVYCNMSLRIDSLLVDIRVQVSAILGT